MATLVCKYITSYQFMIWSHEKNKLNKFLNYLNSRHPKIKRALGPRDPKFENPGEKKPFAKVYQPYMKDTTEQIENARKDHNIHCSQEGHRHPTSAKIKMNLENQEAYKILCRSRDQSYISEINERMYVRKE